jgi:hypothetical protein
VRHDEGKQLTTPTSSCPAVWSVSDRAFYLLLVSLVAAAILRSAIATRLDSFTQDEGYHILAGVSYVQRGDFRINPEHPPLVKLWVGSILAGTGFHLSPFREMHDKGDERDFAEEDVYLHNDSASVQRRARIAMWGLNGLLLAGFTLALRRVFGPGPALAVLAILVIDPTVAAHLPLVLTDLPISLLGATAVVLAGRAFWLWSTPDLVATSVVLGLALATKHSAPVFGVLLALTGLILAWIAPRSNKNEATWRRIAKLSAVLAGAIVILWACYLFRFTESSTSKEVFNRPLAAKIADLQSPVHRFLLTRFSGFHLLPRAYIWGFADTIRAGIEGRVETRLFYGRTYYGKVPAYFFPGILAAKLPLGLILLVLIGLFLFVRRRLSPSFCVPLLVVLAVSSGFFCVLMSGATYGGMRHALPLAFLLYIFAGMALYTALTARSQALKAAGALAIVLAAVSALPVLRPYEYYNELIGMKKACFYFNDEGVDAEQRGKELFRYYSEKVRPAGEIPYLYYNVPLSDLKAHGADYMGSDPERDAVRMSDPWLTGTIFIGRWSFSRKPFWDAEALRAATPAARFGNLFVFHGTYYAPGLVASDCFWAGILKLYLPKPDTAAAERLFRQSLKLDAAAYFVYIELANLALARGAREEALRDYEDALHHAGAEILAVPIEEQIRRLSASPTAEVPPLRDPFLE